MAATLVLAMGVSFTSCKDYDEELVAEMNAQAQSLEELNEQLAADKAELTAVINSILPTVDADIAALEAEIAALQARVKELEAIDHNQFATKEELEAAKAELAAAIAELDEAIAALAEAKADKAALEEVASSLEDLKGEFASHVQLFNALSNTMNEAIARLEAQDKALSEALNNAVAEAKKNLEAVQTELTKVAAQAAAADALAKANSEKIAVLEENDEDLAQALVDSVAAVRAEAAANLAEAKAYTDAAAAALEEELAATNATVAELQAALDNAVAELQDQIDVLQEELDEMYEELAEVNERVDGLVDEIAGIKETLNKQITGVSVHGAYSPVIGYFSWPTGVKSNILAAYYGSADADVEFPTALTANNVGAAIDEEVFEAMGFVSETYSAGVLIGDNGNAGKLYLTINPAEVEVTADQLALVNSLGEKSPATITDLKVSTEKLAFGYTRAGAVSLYEAEATIAAEDVENAKLRIELSALKDAIKDVVTVKDGVNLTDVVTTLYTLFNDVADAQAVQATWTDAEGAAHTVYSDYGLATVAVKPLGYNFGADLNVQTVPGYESLEDLMIKVGGLLASVSGKVESVEPLVDSAKDKVKAELVKYLDKINGKLCASINSLNVLLQPTMLVSTVDGFCMLSSAKNTPTIIDNASAVLVPTSFTAEILAPAYKKFVAVTNAYDVNGNEDIDAAKAANTGDLATVLNGETRTVEFNGKAGYTYEITYSAVDFYGMISNTKYYVRVK